MSTYLNAEMELKFKNKDAKKTRLAVYNSDMVWGGPEDGISKESTVEEMLDTTFNEVETPTDNSVYCQFYDDCSYGFASELEDGFRKLVADGIIEDGSTLYEMSDDDGHWEMYWKVENGQVVQGHNVSVTVYDNELATGELLLKALKAATEAVENMTEKERDETARQLKESSAAQVFYGKILEKING